MAGRSLTVGVAELVRRLGNRQRVRRAVPFEGVAVSTAAVVAGEDVVVDLELESISNGIVAVGTVAVPWTGACRRCLEEVRATTVSEVREIFERHPTEGETYPLAGDTVDLEPMVRDAVVLALPLAPLCEAGCRGPDPEDFPTGVADAGDKAGDEEDADSAPDGPADERPRDPRWAALDQLRFE